jgi:hypothetical protein
MRRLRRQRIASTILRRELKMIERRRLEEQEKQPLDQDKKKRGRPRMEL